MLFLPLIFLGSSTLYITLKLSESKTDNTYAVSLFNYSTSAVVSLFFVAGDGLGGVEGISVLIGGLGGAVYFITMLLLLASIRKNGATLSTVFNRLGVLIPILLSFTLFGEKLSVLNSVGIAFAVAAIVIINYKKEKTKDVKIWALLALIVFSGLCDVMPKFFEYFGNPEDSDRFIFFIFLFAAVLSAGATVISKKKVNKYCAIYGSIGGFVNYFVTRFLLMALGELPSYIVYPVCSVGIVIVTSVASRIMFKEKMNRQQLFGIGLILIALVLLNI